MGFVKLTEQFLRNLIDHSSSNVAREGLHGQLTELVDGQAAAEEAAAEKAAAEAPLDHPGLGPPSEGDGVDG